MTQPAFQSREQRSKESFESGIIAADEPLMEIVQRATCSCDHHEFEIDNVPTVFRPFDRLAQSCHSCFTFVDEREARRYDDWLDGQAPCRHDEMVGRIDAVGRLMTQANNTSRNKACRASTLTQLAGKLATWKGTEKTRPECESDVEEPSALDLSTIFLGIDPVWRLTWFVFV